MKKMLFICMVGSLFFLTSVATASEVVSVNTVGYTPAPKLKANGYVQVGINFEAVNAESGVDIRINDLFAEQFPGQFNANLLAADADQIIIDSATYYYTYSPAAPGNTYWRRLGTAGATEDCLPVGAAVWFFRQSYEIEDFVLVGQATTIPDFNLEVKADGYTMISNTYPIDMPLNSENVFWINATPNLLAADADQIITESATYYYTYSPAAPETFYWRRLGTAGATGDVIFAGNAAWYWRQNSEGASFIFLNPYVDL